MTANNHAGNQPQLGQFPADESDWSCMASALVFRDGKEVLPMKGLYNGDCALCRTFGPKRAQIRFRGRELWFSACPCCRKANRGRYVVHRMHLTATPRPAGKPKLKVFSRKPRSR